MGKLQRIAEIPRSVWLVLGTFFLFIVIYLYFIPLESRIRGCLVTTMFQVELCPGSKNYVPLNKISKNIQWAVITSEDGLFYQHDGFDWEALESSFQEVMKSGKYKRGGSTITQQLAKNMFLTKDKTLFRKFREALITWKIERTLTKSEILERYLNVIEFGQGIYGIKKATQHYFQKSPANIDPAEAAFLAMILPNPQKYSRSFRKKDLTPFAKRRISSIVNNMFRSGYISRASYEQSLVKLQDFFGVKPDPIDESLDLTLDDPDSNFPQIQQDSSQQLPGETSESTPNFELPPEKEIDSSQDVQETSGVDSSI